MLRRSYGLNQTSNRGSTSGKGNGLFPQIVLGDSGSHPPSYSVTAEAVSPGIKRQGLQRAIHPPSAEIKNA